MNELSHKTEAHIARRFLAGFIDYLIIFIGLFFYLYTFGEPNEEGGYGVSGFLALIPPLFWGFMTIGFEQIFGATFGNMFVDLKPVSINGIDYELSFSQSFIRHLFDPVDMFFFGIVGILVINNSDKHQRIGDIVAKTIVVKSKKK